MRKKDTTTREAREDSASVIAAHVAAILQHPDTPATLYNALADAVCGLDAPARFFDSQEYIALCLRGALAYSKGGAR